MEFLLRGGGEGAAGTHDAKPGMTNGLGDKFMAKKEAAPPTPLTTWISGNSSSRNVHSTINQADSFVLNNKLTTFPCQSHALITC